MSLIDIDQAKHIHWRPWRPAGFRRKDYLASGVEGLREAIQHRCDALTGIRPAGRIFLLTHLLQWGYCFNPVSFYFCLDEQDELQVILTEINNTPWNERHQYAFVAQDCRTAHGQYTMTFAKAFHVSPFMAMDLSYVWRFTFDNRGLLIFMGLKRDQEKLFDARLSLQALPYTAINHTKLLWRFPFQCQRIALAIYWQAFRLWLKRIPFIPHPAKNSR